MSAGTIAGATSRVTYAELTDMGCRRIALALATVHSRELRGSVSGDDVAAYRDLAAALAQLGTVLITPPRRLDATGRRSAPRRGPDAKLVASLQRAARARDWDQPHPVEGIGADLDRAAVLVRAAADLWATHHTPEGHPRSLEGSRMRHPATLGAALRQWRSMVALSSSLTSVLTQPSAVADLTPTAVEPQALAPLMEPARRKGHGSSASAGTGRGRTARPGASPGLLHLTVARPGLRRGEPPLAELAQRIDRLRNLAWQLASTGSAPATVHGNMAAIGVAVHSAAAGVHRSLASSLPPGPEKRSHAMAEERVREGLSRWQMVADDVRALRSAHPATHPIQLERMDIHRLLGRLAPRGGVTSPQVGWELSRLADSFAEIADSGARAVRAAHDRGDLLLVGRAIPSEALPRRPDLLRARLSDEVIAAPALTIARLEARYRDIARGAHQRTSPDVSPPAA